MDRADEIILRSILNIISNEMIKVETLICDVDPIPKDYIVTELKFCYAIIDRCFRILDKKEHDGNE